MVAGRYPKGNTMINTTCAHHKPTEDALTSGPWSPFSHISASLDASKDQAVLSDAWRGRRVAIGRTALLDLLTALANNPKSKPPLAVRLEQFDMFGPLELDEETMRHATHWWQRGWIPSLDLYLWSRHNRFLDRDDPEGQKRRSALAQYLEQESPPARLIPSGVPVQLPEPAPLPEHLTLGEVLMRRRTIRSYALAPVPLAVLSGVLWHGTRDVRAVRSLSGADPIHYLHSYGVALDPYVVVYGVEGIRPGIYYYSLEEHRLIALEEGLFREEMTQLLFDQASPESAAWTMLWVADFSQFQWRYRHERAIRHLYFDAGRIAQEYILAGGAYAISSFPTPATRDQATITRLRLDPHRQAPIYTLTMGWDKRFYTGSTHE